MKVITIFNNKGGVGKTTSTQNIGAALALFADQRVLVIDLDQQANLTMGFGIDPREVANNSANFILGEASLEETRIKCRDSTLDILPASPSLRKQRESIELKAKGYPTNLRKALAKISDQYDFIVIDCPPTLSSISDIALVACSQYYIPLQPQYYSYEGLRNLAEYVDELRHSALVQEKVPGLKIELGGVFAVGFNPKANLNVNKEIVDSVKEQLGTKMLSTYIRNSVALTEAQIKGLNIFDYEREYKRGRKAAEDYHTLAVEIYKNMYLWENKQKKVSA